MAADPIVYCLDHVTDYAQFERLCHDLMAKNGYLKIEPLGGFKDKGRDAVHISIDNKVITIFAYSVREDWRAKLAEDAEKIHKHGHICQQLVFITTSTLTSSARDEAIEFLGRTYSWHLELYGVERLRVMLAQAPDLMRLHPQIFTPSLFSASNDPNEQLQMGISPTRRAYRQMAQIRLFNRGPDPFFISSWCAAWGP